MPCLLTSKSQTRCQGIQLIWQNYVWMYYHNDYSRDRFEGLNISITSGVLSCRYSRLAERRMRDEVRFSEMTSCMTTSVDFAKINLASKK